MQTSLRRRDLLAGIGAGLLAGTGATDRAYAHAVEELRARPVGQDRLWLRRSSGQEIVARHRNDGTYDDNALLHLAWFMRDVGDQDRAVWMEPRLFDLLAGVQSAMSMIHGSALPIVITSGYRTPAHNARTEGAAQNSMHLYGYAADLLVPGYGPRAPALAAQLVGGAGIGLYADFIHLDVWRPRIWLGKSARRPGTAAPKPTPAAPASTPAATAAAPKPS
jgi:uncharacterized protein YcbK (DUF882 family)